MSFLLARPRLSTALALALGALLGCDPLSAPPPGGESSGSSTQPAGEHCGGLAGEACAKGTFCDYPSGAFCGAADQTGTCQPIPDNCDAQYDPVCGCDDRTYGNECEAHAKGVSVAHAGACTAAPQPDDASVVDAGPGTKPPSVDAGSAERVCGGFAGLRCGAGQFCDYGATCSSIADGTGVCRVQPERCGEIYAPVCGCDGTTYPNACSAQSKGVSVAAKGECKQPGQGGQTCGGIAALACGPASFCNYEAPNGQGCDGTVADAAGVCQPIPQGCTLEYAPVCGCDGNTYGSACAAHSAGVSVAGSGECAPKRVSCDRRKLLCRRAEPVCPAGQTASIEGTCYGPCVNIEQCSCDAAEACPNPDQYTCHRSRMVCGPYVN